VVIIRAGIGSDGSYLTVFKAVTEEQGESLAVHGVDETRGVSFAHQKLKISGIKKLAAFSSTIPVGRPRLVGDTTPLPSQRTAHRSEYRRP